MPASSLEGGLLDNEPAAMERLIALNITAPTLLAAAAGKAFVARGEGAPHQHRLRAGRWRRSMFDGVYSGSKAYVLNLTLSLAAKLKNARRARPGGDAGRHPHRDLGALRQGCGRACRPRW
jgi:short-subunit dehydrogenase